MAGRRLFGLRPLALAILSLALAVRLWNLTARSLWFDEAVEYWVATAPFARIPAAVRDVLQDPPLYSFLLHLWMEPGVSDAWLRLPSMLCGVGAVLGVMVIGYRLQGWTTALAAGGLLSILPTAVRYSQEVGQYAPMHCLVAWNLAVLLGLVHSPGRGGFVRWTALAAGAAWTYYGAIVPILVPFLLFLLSAAKSGDRLRLKRGVIALATFVAAILPLALWFLPHQLGRGPTENAFAADVELVEAGVANVMAKIPEAIAFPLTGWPCSRTPVYVTVALFVALGALAFRRQRRVVVAIVATLAVYAGAGALNLFPFGARYSTILVPMYVVLVACALPAAGAYGKAGRALFALLCVACLTSLPNRDLYRRVYGEGPCIWPETEDVEQVARYWMEHRDPHQPTYVYYGAAPAFAYYVDRMDENSAPREPGWFLSCWRGEPGGSCGENDVFYGRWTRALVPVQKLASVYETVGKPQEFWFVAAHAHANEDITIGRLLQEEYTFVDVNLGRNAVAVLLRRNP